MSSLAHSLSSARGFTLSSDRISLWKYHYPGTEWLASSVAWCQPPRVCRWGI